MKNVILFDLGNTLAKIIKSDHSRNDLSQSSNFTGSPGSPFCPPPVGNVQQPKEEENPEDHEWGGAEN